MSVILILIFFAVSGAVIYKYVPRKEKFTNQTDKNNDKNDGKDNGENDKRIIIIYAVSASLTFIIAFIINKFVYKNNILSSIISAILWTIGILGGIFFIMEIIDTKTYYKQQGEQVKLNNTSVQPPIICPSGEQGEQGYQGERGKSIGNFINKGTLGNIIISDQGLVLDRRCGFGKGTYVYMNDSTSSSTNQKWTLNTNNTITNGYGGCLTGSVSGDVYIDNKCSDTDTSAQWTYNNNMLMWNEQPNKCLTIQKLASLVGGNPVINNYKCDQNNTVQANIYKTYLTDCNSNNNYQKWYWN